MKYINTDNAVQFPVRSMHEETPFEVHRRIKEDFLKGKFVHDSGQTAIIKLLQMVEKIQTSPSEQDELEKLRRRVREQSEYIEKVESLVQPPDCRNCSSEMTLDKSTSLYTCDCMGGCSCFQSAPCSHCLNQVDVGAYIDEGGIAGWESDGDDPDFEDNQKTRYRTRVESGYSAAERAKPVTPKLIIGCQGDWWDGTENL